MNETCEWSPWSGCSPVPAQPQQCRNEPTSQARRSCSLGWPGLHLAYTPSPCRGSGRPGMHKTAGRQKNKVNDTAKWLCCSCKALGGVRVSWFIPVLPSYCWQRPWYPSLPRRKQSPTSWSSQTCWAASWRILSVWLCASPTEHRERKHEQGLLFTLLSLNYDTEIK